MKILIVDDNEDLRMILRKTLEHDRHIVESACNGEEALKKAKVSLPDMIISDILMPGMDGFRLCHELKQDEQLQEIPLVLYTANYVDPKDERLAMSLGASRFIIKPLETDEFLKIIHDVFREYDKEKLPGPEKPYEEKYEFSKMYEESVVRKLDETAQELKLYRQIFESSKDAIAIINSEGFYTKQNRAHQELIGYSINDLNGKTPAVHFGKEVFSEILKDLSAKGVFSGELISRTKSGAELDIELSAFPVFDSKGEGVGYVVVQRNITERKRTEETMRNIAMGVSAQTGEAFFKSLVVHLAKIFDAEYTFIGMFRDITERQQIEEALRRSQKMEAIGQLSGGIAHDFNNQLGIIIGYLDFLRDYAANDEEPHQWVDTATRATKRCMDLTRQLLAFSRRQIKEKIVVDLNAMLRGLETMIARSVPPEVEVQTFLADDLWPTEIDPGEFQDAILNLVINFRDAMPGGGKLLIETTNKHLDADYAALNPDVEAGDYVQLMLSDTGTGMNKETLEHIFEPFFTTKPEGKGTGLGLAMVYGFVKRYGGYIKVYSESGVGATIRLYLPRTKVFESVVMVNNGHKTVLPTGSESILIVDDETDLLQLADQYLSDLGYRIRLAENAAQALEILANEKQIDLLFSDVVMPGGMNGYELAQQATELRPDLKVLLTSGFTSKTIAHNGLARFSAHLLNKPYRKTDLAQRVRVALDEELKRVRNLPDADGAKDNLAGRTILVIDDEENMRELFQLNLARLGCKTVPACNGDEAIALYRQSLESGEAIDVVILDLTLPGSMGGKEIADKIRALDPHAKMIVASGHTEGPEMTHCQDYGFQGALEKNFNREEIKRVLEQVIQ